MMADVRLNGTPLVMPAVVVTLTREEIVREIEQHRGAIVALEARLGELRTASWPPVGFYLTYYIVAGTMIGILGSLASFIFNVVGSVLVNQDPLRFLRVYGTVFSAPAPSPPTI